MSYSVPAVDNAIRLLKYLKANSHSPRLLAEACDDLDIPRSSGFRILKTLEKHGFVKFDPNSARYSLGLALPGISEMTPEQLNLAEVARPYLGTLARESRLTCLLSQRVEDQSVAIDVVENAGYVRLTIAVGRRIPLPAGAVGKALMAYLDEDEVRSYVARNGLPAFTPASITNIDAFARNLAEVRSLGYACSLEEHHAGVNGVAAAIFDTSGRADFAMEALGFTSSLPRERTDEFGRMILQTARQITAAVGGSWLGPAESGQHVSTTE